MSDTLFKQPRRRVGATEALLAKTLRAWNQEGHLQGDAWAAARGLLRDAARAVDASRLDLQSGEGSAYSMARTVKIYHELLTAYRSGEEVSSGDSIDDLIAALSATPSRD